MLSLKAGVRVRGVSNEILLAIMVAQSVYEEFSLDLTLTSITDGKHKEGSLHYTGEAVDLRLPRTATMEIDGHLSLRIRDALQNALMEGYEVVLEKDHIHVEYDPG